MSVSCEEPSRIKSWIFQPMSSGHKKKDMDIWKDNALVGDDWVKESCDKLLNNTKNQMQEAFFAMFDQAQQRRSKMF